MSMTGTVPLFHGQPGADENRTTSEWGSEYNNVATSSLNPFQLAYHHEAEYISQSQHFQQVETQDPATAFSQGLNQVQGDQSIEPQHYVCSTCGRTFERQHNLR